MTSTATLNWFNAASCPAGQTAEPATPANPEDDRLRLVLLQRCEGEIGQLLSNESGSTFRSESGLGVHMTVRTLRERGRFEATVTKSHLKLDYLAVYGKGEEFFWLVPMARLRTLIERRLALGPTPSGRRWQVQFLPDASGEDQMWTSGGEKEPIGDLRRAFDPREAIQGHVGLLRPKKADPAVRESRIHVPWATCARLVASKMNLDMAPVSDKTAAAAGHYVLADGTPVKVAVSGSTHAAEKKFSVRPTFLTGLLVAAARGSSVAWVIPAELVRGMPVPETDRTNPSRTLTIETVDDKDFAWISKRFGDRVEVTQYRVMLDGTVE